MVTRASEETALGESLTRQLFARPEAMYVSAAALFVISSLGMLLSPGIVPPFLLLTLILGGSAWQIQRTQRSVEEEAKLGQEKEELAPPAPESVESLLEVDPMEIEIGFSLISIVDSTQGGDLLTGQRHPAADGGGTGDSGAAHPHPRQHALQPRQYQIRIRGIKAAEGEIRPDRLCHETDMTEEDDIPGSRHRTYLRTPCDRTDELPRRMSGYSVVSPPPCGPRTYGADRPRVEILGHRPNS